GEEDLAWENFSVPVAPGQTYDGLFKYRNEEEYSPTNPVPITIPNVPDLVYGQLYSGSPYLGVKGPLPVGAPDMNDCGEFYIISHNHALYQITSWGVPASGPITFLRIDPPLPNACH
ncbi:MAG: copper oxidase, partial [Candidatus Promineifilaceae bacterium]